MKKLLLAGCLSSLAALPLHAAEHRTWTSKDGAATIVAELLKVDGEKVVLILANGRSQIIEKKFLSEGDLAWIDANTGATEPEDAADGALASAKIPATLKGNLINDEGKKVELGTDGAIPKYYVFYYSASWCPPCRAFTPELVKFHRRMKARKANFEVILVPSDNSEKEAIAYLKDYKMPWPGVEWSAKNSPRIPKNPGGGIPAVRLTDANGETLLTTEDTDSRTDFLTQAAKIISRPAAETAAN